MPLLTSTAYFPPLSWLAGARDSGGWQIEAHENYQKNGCRNRCRIAGPNGVQMLSVPLVKGKHQRMPIRDVRISYENDWWRRHEQAIRTAYGRAPYYEFYAEAVFEVARTRVQYLWELNQSLLEVVLGQLRFPVAPTLTGAFVRPATPGYLRPADLGAPLPYPQPFADRHGFLGDLSVLDGLFCLGPELLSRALIE